jgi:soluble lytic murein transglycosylase-like protein
MSGEKHSSKSCLLKNVLAFSWVLDLAALLPFAVLRTEPCFALETVYLTNGRSMVIENHQVAGSRMLLLLQGNGRMEIESEWIQGFGPPDQFENQDSQAQYPKSDETYKTYNREEIQRFVRESARKYSLDERLLISMIRAESDFNPLAVSARGARGLMQLMPETATSYKVNNSFDPRENLEAGARYLKDLLQQFNQNLILALAAYNAGPTSVMAYNGIPPFPETTRYVQKVLTLAERRQYPVPAAMNPAP